MDILCYNEFNDGYGGDMTIVCEYIYMYVCICVYMGSSDSPSSPYKGLMQTLSSRSYNGL